MDKISSDDERMTKLLALLFDQITRDKMIDCVSVGELPTNVGELYF